VTITASWPEAPEPIDWPSCQLVSIHQTTRFSHPVSTAGLAPWVHDVKVVAATTGVPARWIAAEMLVESGGRNECFEGLRTQACGLIGSYADQPGDHRR